MDDIEAMSIAANSLAHRLRFVTAENQLDESSCDGWTVYDLVNHVNGGGHRYLLLMRGAKPEDLTPTRSQDHVGSNPEASFWEWQDQLANEFAAVDVLEKIVEHPAGKRTAGELLGMRVLDLTLHSWDLARSLGLPEDIDASLAQHILNRHMSTVDDLQKKGMYGPVGNDPVLSPMHELLQRTGRK